MLNYDLARLKHRVQFGTIKTVSTRTIEGTTTKFVPIFAVWGGEYPKHDDPAIHFAGD